MDTQCISQSRAQEVPVPPFKLFSCTYPHKDLNPSSVLQDEWDNQAIVDVMQTLFVSPFSISELVCISNGMIATKEVKDDLLSAEKER